MRNIIRPNEARAEVEVCTRSTKTENGFKGVSGEVVQTCERTIAIYKVTAKYEIPGNKGLTHGLSPGSGSPGKKQKDFINERIINKKGEKVGPSQEEKKRVIIPSDRCFDFEAILLSVVNSIYNNASINSNSKLENEGKVNAIKIGK